MHENKAERKEEGSRVSQCSGLRALLGRNRSLLLTGTVLWFSLLALLLGSGMERDSYRFEILFFLPFVVYLATIFLLGRQTGEGGSGGESGRDPIPRKPGRPSRKELLAIILLFSILFRALFFFGAPLLSDDVYRYYWEGKVAEEGHNPYEHAPDSEELAPLRDDEWEHINNKDVPASYPPLSQLVFRGGYLLYPDIMVFKIIFVCLDLGSVVLVFLLLKDFNVDPRFAIIYAWSPLVVIEFAHSAHNDSLPIFLTLLSFWALNRDQKALSATTLALGVMAKLFPLFFAPLLFRSWGRKNTALFFGVLALLYLPFMSAGPGLFTGTSTYADRWLFNGSVFPLLVEMLRPLRGLLDPTDLAKVLILLVFSLALFYFVGDRSRGGHEGKKLFKYSFFLVGLYLILTPTLHPWYLIWLIPFLCVFRRWSWLLLSGLVVLSYIIYIDYDKSGGWTELWWVRVLEFLPFYVLFLMELGNSPKIRNQLPEYTDTLPSQQVREEAVPQEKVFVIIPMLNEEEAIGKVLSDIPGELVDEVVVVDNGSTDQGPERARELGATVLQESRKGYGHACLAGLDHVSQQPGGPESIVVFMDGDHSDHPEELANLLAPIREMGCDMVVGSRMVKQGARRAMAPHAALANRFIGLLLSFLLREKVTDLGPFRAIRFSAISSLCMEEKRYGWTVEMIVKAVKKGLVVREVSVSYRRRVGFSKVSGSLVESIKAMTVILYCMGTYLLRTG